MTGNKQKCTRNTAAQYLLNRRFRKAPKSTSGRGVFARFLCLITASPQRFIARHTKPHTLTLQPNPTLGIKYCTMAGKMTPPTLVPTEPIAMAMLRLR